MEYQHAVTGGGIGSGSSTPPCGVGRVWFWCVLLVLGTLLGPGATGVVLVIVPPAAGSRTVDLLCCGVVCGDGGGGCCLGTA